MNLIEKLEFSSTYLFDETAGIFYLTPSLHPKRHTWGFADAGCLVGKAFKPSNAEKWRRLFLGVPLTTQQKDTPFDVGRLA